MLKLSEKHATKFGSNDIVTFRDVYKLMAKDAHIKGASPVEYCLLKRYIPKHSYYVQIW